MDIQDHKLTATSTEGHEGHEVYLCHRCGWPFPKQHPSSKHRRAHKRVCGTIEGYKIIHSEAVSDDEHASDGEEHHTPSPNLAKKKADDFSSGGGVGAKSNKSEDDVFSDAVTEFSDSGISPRLEERFENASGLDKSMEPNNLEGDPNGSESLKVDETAVNPDRTEELNDPTRSEEMSNSGALVNADNQSLATGAEAVSVVPINGLQPEPMKSDIPGDVAVDKAGQHADVEGEEDKLASVILDSVEDKSSDPALASVERIEESCDKLVSEVVKHALPPHIENLQTLDASEGVKSVAHSAKVSSSTESVDEIALAKETNERIDASVEVKEVLLSTEVMDSVEPGGSTKTSDVVSMVPSVDEDKKTSLVGDENAGISDESEIEKCNMDGDENRSLESSDNFSFDTVLAPGSADSTFAHEYDQTAKAFKKDVDHCEVKSDSELLEQRNEKGEVASVEVQLMLDSTMPSDNSTDSTGSCKADSDARNLEELSKTESSSLELRDNGSDKSFQGLGTDKVSEVLQSVGSAGPDTELNNDIGDALDKNSPPTASSEDPVSPVISELPSNIQESVVLAGTVTELKDIDEVVAPEKTPEQPISKESPSLFTNSKIFTENSTNENICNGEGTGASESIDAADVSAKLNPEGNIVVSENSESPAPRGQEASPTKKCSNETSLDAEERHSSEDVSTSKSLGIVSRAELTSDGDVVKSDECSVAPGLKEPVPSSFQDLRETSACEVIKVGDATDVNSKSSQDKVDDKLNKQKDGVSAVDLSGSSSGRSDSLEANCGSVSDTLETSSQKHKATSSDTFEPPSFMTLVQPGSEGNNQVNAASEIETLQNNQKPKADALQAGWFPSLTNVSNESEGRKKNEEIIAKVTNWSPVKQHGSLKNLLNDVKSPNTKQVPAENQKTETEHKDNGAGVTTVSSVLGPEAPVAKDQDTNKDMDEWNSPARYPIEVKKEKKKKKSYWVPFVCCSSVHRDL